MIKKELFDIFQATLFLIIDLFNKLYLTYFACKGF